MENYEQTQQDKKVFYSDLYFFRAKEAPLESANIVASGFINRIGDVTSKNEGDPFQYVEISVTLTDSFVTNHFGADYLNQWHRVTFAISYSGRGLESISRSGIAVGDKVMFGAQKLHLTTETATDGRIFRKVNGYGVSGFTILKKKNETNNGVGTSTAPQTYTQAPQQTSGYQQAPSGWNAPPAGNYAPGTTPAYQAPQAPMNAQPQGFNPMTQQQNYAPVPQQTQGAGAVLCDDCHAELTPAVIKFCDNNAARFMRKHLCQKCQKNYAAPSAAQGQSGSSAVCADCGNPVEKDVVTFCNKNDARFQHKILCRNCQKKYPFSGNSQAQPQQQNYAPTPQQPQPMQQPQAYAPAPMQPQAPQQQGVNSPFAGFYDASAIGVNGNECPF